MDGFESMVQQIDWWLYVIIVCLLLVIILALNYIVKKLNEARLEKRIGKTHNKSVQQSVQFEDQAETTKQVSDAEKLSRTLDKVDNFENYKQTEEMEKVKHVTTENSNSPEEAMYSVGLSNRSSPQSPEETMPTFLGEIYQDRRETIPQSIYENKESNQIDDMITASTQSSPCGTRNCPIDNEGANQNEKVTQNISRNEKMRITESYNDEAESSKEEDRKAKTDKVEQNQVVEKLVICKTCSEKDESSKGKENTNAKIDKE